MSMGSADDLLHYRLQLLQDIRTLESGIGKASTERAKFSDEVDRLNGEVKKFSTVLVAAGFDNAATGGSSNTAGLAPVQAPGTSLSIPLALQEEAVITQAELYSSVEVADPSITDEESLHRLLKSLEKSEKELLEVVERQKAQRRREQAARSASGEPDREVIKLQSELESMQTELRRITTLLHRPLGS